MWWPGGNTLLLFGKSSTYMHGDLVPFKQTYIYVHWKSKRTLTKLMPVHQTCQLTVWNFIRQDCCLVECHSRELLHCCSCNIYACWPSVFTATNTAAIQVCQLVECCCKMDACWIFATQSCMWDGGVLPYLSYMLVWCLTISRACWCDASL